MGSTACAQCGAVRWDSSLRCPECGSATTLPEPPTGLAPAPPPPTRRRVLNVPWREVRDAPRAPRNRRRERAEIAVALATVGILAAAVIVYDLPHFGTPEPSPQVVIPAGHVWPPTGGVGGSSGLGFTAQRAGTLTGAFRVSLGTAELCVSTFPADRQWSANASPPSQCPSNVTYSTGFVATGQLSVAVAAGPIWLTWFPPLNTTEYSPPWNVTWSATVEIVPS